MYGKVRRYTLEERQKLAASMGVSAEPDRPLVPYIRKRHLAKKRLRGLGLRPLIDELARAIEMPRPDRQALEEMAREVAYRLRMAGKAQVPQHLWSRGWSRFFDVFPKQEG